MRGATHFAQLKITHRRGVGVHGRIVNIHIHRHVATEGGGAAQFHVELEPRIVAGAHAGNRSHVNRGIIRHGGVQLQQPHTHLLRQRFDALADLRPVIAGVVVPVGFLQIAGNPNLAPAGIHFLKPIHRRLEQRGHVRRGIGHVVAHIIAEGLSPAFLQRGDAQLNLIQLIGDILGGLRLGRFL